MSNIETRGSKLTKKTKQPEERLSSGDMLMLSVILPNLPDRDELLTLSQGGNIVAFPRQIKDEKWEIELRKSSIGEQKVLFILMHTKDDVGQETTYGIYTDPNIQEIKGRVIGARGKPMINSYGEPMNFDETASAFKELMFGKEKPLLNQKVKSAKPHRIHARKLV